MPSSGAFNWGFGGVAVGISWLATRTVRRAAIMFVIYLVFLGFGLNQFRQTPVGFIPQVDGGYVILVVQLPPGASLARTDAVQQRALDIALEVPGIAHGANIVGFSGATFTNAPNSGAIFLVLDPFEKRAASSGPIGTAPSRRSSTAGCRKSRTPSSSRRCRRRSGASAPPAASA